MRRWASIACLAATLAGLGWGAARVVAAWRFEDGLAWARREAASGRFDEARRWLAALPRERLADPEVADLLGTCEHEAGHFEAALAAWSRVPAGSPRGTRAALARARTLVGDLGRFADAETLLEATLRSASGPGRVEVGHTLGQLYFWERRREAMRRLIRAGWRESPRPASELRDLWQIDDSTTLVDDVRREVERAARLAADDDRVWLAQANLDTLTGRFDDARRRLDACLGRRPDDPAVWIARLEWARASGRPDEARRALDHLADDALSPAETLDALAWLASRRGDADGERQALERLIDREPGNTRALDRLATLAHRSGQAGRAAEFRDRKARLDAVKDQYRRLLVEHAPTGNFDELGALAEALGRRFEAHGWYVLASRRDPGNSQVAEALARLGPADPAGPSTPRPLPTHGGDLPRIAPPGRAEVPTPDFRDDAGRAGLRFVFDNGRSPLRQLPETTAGGVAMLDYDGDGRLDVYVLQGGAFPPAPDRPNTGDRLFRNRGDGTFEDVTDRAGIGRMARGYGHGVAVGDFDDDGHPDLFVTRWRSYALYRNRGDGTFEDATEKAALGGDRDWPTSAAFADLDNDGDLDLYVCHYLAWDAEHPTLCPRPDEPGKDADPSSRYSYCMPHPFPARPDHLFRNDGGRFVDVSAGAGIVDRDGRGLGVVAADLDDDGRVDLFVANDTTANYLFHNLGGMKFEEVGFSAGVACNADGAFQAGMGTACGDLDGDGRLDLLVTNFHGESTSFFENLGGLAFGDQTAAIGLAAPSRFLLGFGIVLIDANNDGRLDLATANGHVNDERPKFPYAMPAQLLIGGADGRLADASEVAGPPWQVPRVGRGLASGDLDNDGRADLLLVAQQGPLAYFHNRTAGGRSVTFRLEGTASNRDGVGARVVVTSGGRRQVACRSGGGSFQSSSDPRLRFGLGDRDRVESVEVRWPSGRVDRHRDLAAGAGYLLREGAPGPLPLPGFPPKPAP